MNPSRRSSRQHEPPKQEHPSALRRSALQHDQERRKQIAMLNAERPRLTGALIKKCHGFLGEFDQHCWVTLDPQESRLSIWETKPNSKHFGPPPGKKPKNELSMDKLVEVDHNPVFRMIFLTFQGEAQQLHLVSQSDEVFREWYNALAAYGSSSSFSRL